MSVMTIGPTDPNSNTTVAQSLMARRSVAATASTAGTTATTAASAAAASAESQGISSNDFLTLLVTEMKNQDPTQPTDPNAYIQQLVGVNSLQQLISINQDLSSTATAGTPTATSGVTSPAAIGS